MQMVLPYPTDILHVGNSNFYPVSVILKRLHKVRLIGRECIWTSPPCYSSSLLLWDKIILPLSSFLPWMPIPWSLHARPHLSHIISSEPITLSFFSILLYSHWIHSESNCFIRKFYKLKGLNYLSMAGLLVVVLLIGGGEGAGVFCPRII